MSVKVEFRDGYTNAVNQIDFEEIELKDVIYKQLQQADYHAGEIETVRGYVDTLQNTVASLLELLFEEKKLNGNQLCAILSLTKGSIKRIRTD